MTYAELPHGFPFRFADAVLVSTGRAEGRVRASVTAAADASRGGPLAPALFGELIAQAALLLEGGGAELGRKGFLAGISDLAVRRPAVPGDFLDVEVRVSGRFGDFVKFDGAVSDAAGAEVARASVLVRTGKAA